MLRIKFLSWAKLLLISALLLPALADAKTAAKAETVDLSILKQRDALYPYMTASQRVDYLQLEKSITQAQSDLRSGQNLANAKPSNLDPDRDLKPVIERGKRLIAQAEAAIVDAQREMVELLQTLDVQKKEQLAVDLTKYDFTLDAANYDEALVAQARKLMEACWALGYETLFFDGLFIQDSEGLRRAEAGLRNQAYDVLVKIDGSNFSVTVPVDFQLKPGTLGNSRHIFNYENAAIFKDDKKALLALKVIVPEDSATGLLCLRAVDLDTQAIAAQALVKISDLATVLDLPTEGLGDHVPKDVQLRDPNQTIDLFAGLSNPYTFQLVDTPNAVAAACIADTLLHNSSLQIVDSDFIKLAYGETLEQPEAWVGQANAQLGLEPTEEDGAYQVTATANDSDRTLSVGTLSLGYPAAPEPLADAQ